VKYEPKPLPTDGIHLADDLTSLTERLAEHVHDVWAKKRLAEGWRFGPRRSDRAKTRPDLVPYSQLSESEKDYDRETARETLKAVLALGFRIARD
jgi:hypothetical protein